jgi:hypothetical protein
MQHIGSPSAPPAGPRLRVLRELGAHGRICHISHVRLPAHPLVRAQIAVLLAALLVAGMAAETGETLRGAVGRDRACVVKAWCTAVVHARAHSRLPALASFWQLATGTAGSADAANACSYAKQNTECLCSRRVTV